MLKHVIKNSREYGSSQPLHAADSNLLGSLLRAIVAHREKLACDNWNKYRRSMIFISNENIFKGFVRIFRQLIKTTIFFDSDVISFSVSKIVTLSGQFPSIFVERELIERINRDASNNVSTERQNNRSALFLISRVHANRVIYTFDNGGAELVYGWCREYRFERIRLGIIAFRKGSGRKRCETLACYRQWWIECTLREMVRGARAWECYIRKATSLDVMVPLQNFFLFSLHR